MLNSIKAFPEKVGYGNPESRASSLANWRVLTEFVPESLGHPTRNVFAGRAADVGYVDITIAKSKDGSTYLLMKL